MYTLKYERKRGKDTQLRIDTQLSDLSEELLFFEILARLPVKYLLRCRCVCRSWKTLISSPDFINAHLKRNFLKSASDYLVIHTSSETCLSLYHPETFEKCLDLELPRDKHVSLACYGSCNGLLCISATWRVNLKRPIYLLNPSIRKIRRLPDCHIQKSALFATLGFGFDNTGNDCKVVKVVRFNQRKKNIFGVEVYKLGEDAWRRITAAPPVSREARFPQPRCVCLNGVLYWITVEVSQKLTFIVTFDLSSEVFGKIMLPDRPSRVVSNFNKLNVQVFEESLSLFHVTIEDGNEWNCDVWILEAGTWAMNRRIGLPKFLFVAWPLGIRTDNRVLVVMEVLHLANRRLVLYNPESQQVRDTGIRMSYHYQFIDAYSESLILRD